ncbi:MAG: hypothetical protein GQ578_00965 [Desulfuromonadaceae bacterium]|nr:hypothetical protein [Desulfuromonadaceae bacterium]
MAAAKKLLQIDPGAKIIVASGYLNDPIMADYKDYGFRAAVAKPFELKDLILSLLFSDDVVGRNFCLAISCFLRKHQVGL